jgi:hypothetical protein
MIPKNQMPFVHSNVMHTSRFTKKTNTKNSNLTAQTSTTDDIPPNIDPLSSKIKRNSRRLSRQSTSIQVLDSVINKVTVMSDEISLFKMATRKIIGLLRIARLLKSRGRHSVENGLKKVHILIKDPANAGIMEDIGVCDILVNLLNLDPVSHWPMVGSSLRAIYLLAISSQCSLSMINSPSFTNMMSVFLKSDSTSAQRLCAGIIARCFQQPPYNEHLILNNKKMCELLFRCLELSYNDISKNILKLLEEFTYHCPNTALLFGQSFPDQNNNSSALICGNQNAGNSTGAKVESYNVYDSQEDNIQLLIDIMTYNKTDPETEELKFIALNILRNIVICLPHELSVLKTFLKHSAYIEQITLRVSCDI